MYNGISRFFKEVILLRGQWNGRRLLLLKIIQLVPQQLMKLKLYFCNQLRFIYFLITFMFSPLKPLS